MRIVFVHVERRPTHHLVEPGALRLAHPGPSSSVR
jgi:hypothetical protein